MLNKLLTEYKKHKEGINYLIFGALTTFLNIATFAILNAMDVYNPDINNIIAWIVGVLFAYATNRAFVFESKEDNIIKEFAKFTGARVTTGLIDQAIIMISARLTNSDLILLAVKVASNVIVIILNYILSKIFVFKKEKTEAK